MLFRKELITAGDSPRIASYAARSNNVLLYTVNVAGPVSGRVADNQSGQHAECIDSGCTTQRNSGLTDRTL